jgi:hypothetical protein
VCLSCGPQDSPNYPLTVRACKTAVHQLHAACPTGGAPAFLKELAERGVEELIGLSDELRRGENEATPE